MWLTVVLELVIFQVLTRGLLFRTHPKPASTTDIGEDKSVCLYFYRHETNKSSPLGGIAAGIHTKGDDLFNANTHLYAIDFV